MNIKVKLAEGASIPKYQKPGDSGMDLTATSIRMVDEENYGFIEYGTGVFIEIPEGYEGQIRPRSSISNTGLIMANSPGTIDSNYRGEIKVRFKAIPNSFIYEVGDRIAQLVITPVIKANLEVVEELSETERGEDGFGSTGK